jgi:cytochrome c biogenesis protein
MVKAEQTGWPTAMKTVITCLKPESRGITAVLSSARLTQAFLILLFIAVVLYQYLPGDLRLAVLLIPTVLLMINFIALLLVRGAFANQTALLVFHFSLFFLVILAMLGQLTYLKGTLELGSMEEFDGRLENVQAGIWHDYQLGSEKFTNLGFDINYRKGIKRNNTLNRIRLGDDPANAPIIEIGDQVPLALGHYRFYTTHNKGYSPLFRWFPADGSPSQLGSVHLPAYPIHRYKQAREWSLPGSQQKIWTMLVIEEDVLPENRAFNFRIPYQHHLVIRIGDQRTELRPGDEISLEAGVLRYETLSSWMGYKVDYDWTRPWLLATCLIGMISLAFHYITRIRSL